MIRITVKNLLGATSTAEVQSWHQVDDTQDEMLHRFHGSVTVQAVNLLNPEDREMYFGYGYASEVNLRKPVSLRKSTSAVAQATSRRKLQQDRSIRAARKAVVLLNRPSFRQDGPLVAEVPGTFRAFLQVCHLG
jgi:hypothetical protein